MSHPSRFEADDPYLARLREVCLALPEAAEKVSHGHPNFYTTKVFAVFGGVVKGDHYNTRSTCPNRSARSRQWSGPVQRET